MEYLITGSESFLFIHKKKGYLPKYTARKGKLIEKVISRSSVLLFSTIFTLSTFFSGQAAAAPSNKQVELEKQKSSAKSMLSLENTPLSLLN